MIRCLLVDDEPLAHTVLESHIEKLNDFQILGNCYDATSAIQFFHENEVDVVFLDIQMPDLTGMEFLQTLNHAPLIVFVTAYSEYALESYEFAAVDYLLKPVRYARFLKTIEKIRARLQTSLKPVKKQVPVEFLSIQDGGSIHRLAINSITHIQSWGNYVRIFVDGQVKLDRRTMTDLENTLNTSGFLRCHKSYLINSKKISRLEGNRLYIKDLEIPIGESYKQAVKSALS
jgi:DNA-binding LytR/AlgR family response regulator